MTKISEKEFARLCEGIYEDREKIWKHNPIGAIDETLLWMLLSVLNSYLSLSEIETPCFTGPSGMNCQPPVAGSGQAALIRPASFVNKMPLAFYQQCL